MSIKSKRRATVSLRETRQRSNEDKAPIDSKVWVQVQKGLKKTTTRSQVRSRKDLCCGYIT